MIKSIVLDISNVLVDYDIKGFLAGKGFGPEMIKRIVKASVMSHHWADFERGDLTEEEAMRAFAGNDPEIEQELYEAYENINGMLKLRDGAIDFIKQLKALGYNVYYLSNYSGKAFRECSESLAFTEYTDGGCLSFQERLAKPDPAFYKRFLEKYGLDAKECIFADDTSANVEAAIQLGFTGIVFTSFEETLKLISLKFNSIH